MEIRMIIFLSGFVIPLTLFVFFRKLLNEPKYQKLLLIIFSVLAAIGIAIVLIKNQAYSFYLMLILPLISYWIYRMSLSVFRKKNKRNPKDTAMDWRDGLDHDRLFNIGYVIFGIVIPFIIVGLLIGK